MEEEEEEEEEEEKEERRIQVTQSDSHPVALPDRAIKYQGRGEWASWLLLGPSCGGYSSAHPVGWLPAGVR